MPDNSNSTVYVIDDDQAVLGALSLLLTAEGYAVRAHQSARTFLETIRQDDSGCVVTDVRMPEIDGLELLAAMEERLISMPVIVITAHGDIPLAIAAMKRGAIDFFQKPFNVDALLASIRAALARGDRERRSDAEMQTNRVSFATLSKREKEVLARLLDGQPNKTIARALGISARTVEVYRANLMGKMRATSLAELVKKGLSCRTRGGAKPLMIPASSPRSKPDAGLQTSDFSH
ncbi:MAG TPA: response regulator [Methylocystis sp.]